ncbi:MAG: MFS transporter [Clostridia bacterium]|nr:MFS transporter [Clostridia bacterium]MBQ7687786.1 MFS transporter [Clostridia bacterium]MBR0537141.1 MFS transporter [Clostridia bacterium]
MSKNTIKKAGLGTTYTRRELTGFLIGLAGQNIIYNIIGSGLTFYFQNVIFIPAVACSIIFAIARVWDAVNDPMMGTIVDKTRTKWGKCKPYLLFIPPVIMITTILPFINGMYASTNEKYEVKAAAHTEYVDFVESEFTAFETVTFKGKDYEGSELDGKTFAIVSLNNTWELPKDADGNPLRDDDGNLVKTPVMVYEIGADEAGNKTYTVMEEAGVDASVVEGFKAVKGVDTVSGGKGVWIIIWAAFSYILWGMTYTIGDIPLWGVTSLMTEDQKDRAKALSLARICAAFGFIGMMFTFIAPSFKGIFLKSMDDQHALRAAYILTAVILTVFSCILFEFAGLSVHERVEQSSETHTMKENFQTMWSCVPFRRLLISGVLRSPIQLLSLVAMPLVLYFFFNNNDPIKMLKAEGGLVLGIKTLLLLVGVMGGMLISSGITPGLGEKIGKKKLYNIYSVFGAIPFVLVFVLYYVSHKMGIDLLEWKIAIPISLIFFIASWAQGGLNVLQSVMIADCVDYEEYHNGIRPDGVFFSGQSFITKLSSGIASLIYGGVSAIVGFSGANLSILNAALLEGAKFAEYGGGKYATALFFVVSIPPAIGMVLSALPTLKYELTDAEHTRILNELNAAREAK